MAAPGERFEGDAHATLHRLFTELMKIRCRTIDSAERVRRDIAAHHQQVAAKLLHDVEFSLGALESACTLRLGHAFEVAERLQRYDFEPERGDLARSLRRRDCGG